MIFLKRYKKYSVFRFKRINNDNVIKQKELYTIINRFCIMYGAGIDAINLSDPNIDIYCDNEIITYGTFYRHAICTDKILAEYYTYYQFNKSYNLSAQTKNTIPISKYLRIKKFNYFKLITGTDILYEKDIKTNKINYLNGQKVNNHFCVII